MKRGESVPAPSSDLFAGSTNPKVGRLVRFHEVQPVGEGPVYGLTWAVVTKLFRIL